jgi:hypothetical protein
MIVIKFIHFVVKILIKVRQRKKLSKNIGDEVYQAIKKGDSYNDNDIDE